VEDEAVYSLCLNALAQGRHGSKIDTLLLLTTTLLST
jgi:hypothetical protein